MNTCLYLIFKVFLKRYKLLIVSKRLKFTKKTISFYNIQKLIDNKKNR